MAGRWQGSGGEVAGCVGGGGEVALAGRRRLFFSWASRESRPRVVHLTAVGLLGTEAVLAAAICFDEHLELAGLDADEEAVAFGPVRERCFSSSRPFTGKIINLLSTRGN